MTTKPTAGPWHFASVPGTFQSRSERRVLLGQGGKMRVLTLDPRTRAPNTADEALIEAAPDMFAACQAGARYCNALKRHQDAGDVGAIESTEELEALFLDWHEKTHVALEKAMGAGPAAGG